jgi:preprotein translocase subunit YajC
LHLKSHQLTEHNMTEEQKTLNDLSNRVARSCIAVVDTVVTRGGFKGEELTTVGQLRDQAIQVVALYETVAKAFAEEEIAANKSSKSKKK